jgi:hypothetical protein
MKQGNMNTGSQQCRTEPHPIGRANWELKTGQEDRAKQAISENKWAQRGKQEKRD